MSELELQLVRELGQTKTELVAAEELVTRFKEASGLVGKSGDPDDIRPEHVAKYIADLERDLAAARARLAVLEPLGRATEHPRFRILDNCPTIKAAEQRWTVGLRPTGDPYGRLDLIEGPTRDEAVAAALRAIEAQGKPRPQLSPEAKSARKPPPPEALVDALQDTIHTDLPAEDARPAKTIEAQSEGGKR